MSQLSAEPAIGCVSYLNSKPLVYGHEDAVSFETPASLTDGMRAGRLQVALAPIFALIANPEYLVVDGVGIVSRGPVYSVVIVHRGELADLRHLYLDTASRTSANLQRVLLAEFYGLNPLNVPLPLPGELQPVLKEGEGALLIGDRALDFRLAHAEDEGFQYFDLGEAWKKATGLPFVFAAWHVRPETRGKGTLADWLRGWRDDGLARIDEVVRAETRYPAKVSRRYLTENIHFHVDNAGKRAVAEYARLLHRYGVVTVPAPAGGFCWI
jgi:chorismate dehydratase